MIFPDFKLSSVRGRVVMDIKKMELQYYPQLHFYSLYKGMPIYSSNVISSNPAASNSSSLNSVEP